MRNSPRELPKVPFAVVSLVPPKLKQNRRVPPDSIITVAQNNLPYQRRNLLCAQKNARVLFTKILVARYLPASERFFHRFPEPNEGRWVDWIVWRWDLTRRRSHSAR